MLHIFIKDNNINVLESEDDNDNLASSSSSRSTIDHDYIIKQVMSMSMNKGGNKLSSALEVSPGHPAQMMSSKEGKDLIGMQEWKSECKLKSYKT